MPSKRKNENEIARLESWLNSKEARPENLLNYLLFKLDIPGNRDIPDDQPWEYLYACGLTEKEHAELRKKLSALLLVVLQHEPDLIPNEQRNVYTDMSLHNIIGLAGILDDPRLIEPLVAIQNRKRLGRRGLYKMIHIRHTQMLYNAIEQLKKKQNSSVETAVRL